MAHLCMQTSSNNLLLKNFFLKKKTQEANILVIISLWLQSVESWPLTVKLSYQATFLDDEMSIEHAQQHGHTHLSEVCELLILSLNKINDFSWC